MFRYNPEYSRRVLGTISIRNIEKKYDTRAISANSSQIW